jgi:hypothetical protein
MNAPNKLAEACAAYNAHLWVQVAASKALRHVRDRVGRPGRRLLDRAGQAVTLCGAPPTAYDLSRKSARDVLERAAEGGYPDAVDFVASLLCPSCRAVLEKKGTRS